MRYVNLETGHDPYPDPEPCTQCQGDGYLVYVGEPGMFDEHTQAWSPSEDVRACGHCYGSGVDPASDHPSSLTPATSSIDWSIPDDELPF